MMTDEDSHCLVTTDKHIFAATNKHATEEFLKVVFSVHYVPKLYNEGTSRVNGTLTNDRPVFSSEKAPPPKKKKTATVKQKQTSGHEP
jgi:hypothetical protein